MVFSSMLLVTSAFKVYEDENENEDENKAESENERGEDTTGTRDGNEGKERRLVESFESELEEKIRTIRVLYQSKDVPVPFREQRWKDGNKRGEQ